jgi:hypothetical protein
MAMFEVWEMIIRPSRKAVGCSALENVMKFDNVRNANLLLLHRIGAAYFAIILHTFRICNSRTL